MRARAFAIFATTVLAGTTASLAQDANNNVQRPLPGDAGAQCINAEDIVSYHTVSDDLIRFEMTTGDVMARLRRNCPQLHYHGYISYQPVNGQLCAGFDDVVSRSGMPCRIENFTAIDHTPGDETSDPAQTRP